MLLGKIIPNQEERDEVEMVKHTLEYRTINGEVGTIEEEATTRWRAMSAALEQFWELTYNTEVLIL